ncbi:MAG: C39 family peptidase [Candidatus Limnocylindrales bacterium]
MPARLGRPTAAVAALAAVLWLSLAGAAPAQADKGYRRDVYFAAGYERQVNSVTCTAASTAMMLNFIARRDLNLNQTAILSWEKTRDALRDSVQRGSDPLGWSRAATSYSWTTGRPTTYKWEAYGSARSALRRAATQIARTGKPVGLLVRHGSHAMVMTGFQASIDPTRSSSFILYSILVSDPNGLMHQAYPATASPLNSYLQTDATASYDAAWYGRYIVIVPQG